jgi:glucose/arabinose dehydrogenase
MGKARVTSNRCRLLAAAAAAAALSWPQPAVAQEDVVVHSGSLASATTMALAPDGRIFVAEQAGRLRVIKNGSLLPTPFLTVPVTSSEERGLLGIAFDPSFATNRFLYVYYTAAGPVVNRIVRFTASAANPDVAEAGSEQVILDGIPSQSGYHNGGAIHFGPDGKLYVAVGENHTASNAQSTGSLTGKLLRLNADGTIPTDNPFYGTASGNNRSIWALGLRNPFTFDIQRATGRIFVNDVGASTYEEINEAWSGPNSGGNAGFNFGWPTTEGPTTDSRFETPFHSYTHAGGHCAITGGAFYDPATANFPPEFANDYFFADFCQGWIKSIDLSTKSVSTLLAPSGSRSPVDIDVGEDGSLYYLARGQGNVHRIRYVDAGTAPSIATHPQPVTVPVGGDATFTVAATGSAPLTYRWQRDGVDIPGPTGSSYTLHGAQLADSGARFRAIVSNGLGSATSNAATLTVTDNQPPAATIGAPAAGALYRAGDQISYAGSASDPEDGSLDGARFTWRVDFHHADHVHPFLAPASGARTGTFTIPTSGHTDADVWYRIHLTVRDSGGLETSIHRDVRPRTARVTLAASAPGLRLELDDQPVTAPSSHTGVAGMQRKLSAPSPQVVGAKVYVFSSWSDGGAATHTIATPDADTTYTATFLELPGPLLPDLPGLPLAASSAEPLEVALRAPGRARWLRASRRGIPVRVSAPAGTRVRVALRRGARRLARRDVTVGAGGAKLVRLRVSERLARTAARRILRIEASAAATDGRRSRASRRIVLTR